MSVRDTVSDLYAQKRINGLVAVSFCVASGADLDVVCAEVLALEEAISSGKFRKLDFGDRKIKGG